jgi:hypothetical protein
MWSGRRTGFVPENGREKMGQRPTTVELHRPIKGSARKSGTREKVDGRTRTGQQNGRQMKSNKQVGKHEKKKRKCGNPHPPELIPSSSE